MAHEERDNATQQVGEAGVDKSKRTRSRSRDVVATLKKMSVDEHSASMKDFQGSLEANNYRRDEMDSLGEEYDDEVLALNGRISLLLN
ncbi:hypothetical protein V6N11_034167 [Hibiscus sabdariffa]|uniref:Uncharacterized protein n=1 Tax=Hibiscus sabdariffa TaxID=183260 RepID=A0ABR2S1J8_9ROSI